MTYEPTRSSCQRDTEGRKCGVEGGKDEDEILPRFVKEVCRARGFEVGGKEICVVGDGGQNNDLAMVMVRYQQKIWRERMGGEVNKEREEWLLAAGPKMYSRMLILLII